MSTMVRFGRRTLWIALAIGYALLAHYTNIEQVETLGTLVALAPIGLGLFSFAWHSQHRKTMLALLAGGCAVLLICWNALAQHYSTIYWIEHAGTELLLCVAFARTLIGEREPMCTYFARVVHGPLTSDLECYTRQITKAWVIFFGAMSTVSTLLFYTAPLTTWSTFANFFTAPLICLMFVAEYAVRRYRFPEMKHAHILDGVKAFWKVPVR
jgi:uncharacterized membrane protein